MRTGSLHTRWPWCAVLGPGLALVLGAAGCGRLGYDPRGDEAGDDAAGPGPDAPPGPPSDAAEPDAPPAPPQACSAGFGFARPITVTNGGAALADHQLPLVVDTGALVAAGKLRADCADVRFVEPASGAILPHWLETGCGGAETSFWVRVAPLAAGTTALALVYGDAAATSVSNGAAVFPFFDDFDDGSIADWARYDRRDAADGPSAQTASTAESISPAHALELGARPACFQPPFDGLTVGVRRSPALPATDYILDVWLRAAVLEFPYVTMAVADVRILTDVRTLLAQRLAVCSGMGCTADSGWVRVAVFLPATPVAVLDVELGAGDCATSVLWVDDLRLRHAPSPTPVAVAGAEAACP